MPTLAEQIRAATPLDVGAFMERAVSHYYATRDPFGADGDFITAPEISQMFGEMIGAWAADSWMQLGSPGVFTLLECGPGRGTLMADALRATKNVPGFHAAARIVMMETSPVLRARQQTALAGHAAQWVERLDQVANSGPLIVIANEFLDALPVRQAVFEKGAWAERIVIAKGEGLSFSTRPLLGEAEKWIPAFHLRQGFGGQVAGMTDEGFIVEFSPARDEFVRDVSRMIRARGGAGVFIDYGYDEPGTGDTLQAVKSHEFVPVLEDAGAADLTAHVDFAAVRAAAEGVGLSVSPVIGQGQFLRGLGIEARALRLSARATERQRDDIRAALARLCGGAQMGRLFRVVVLASAPEILAGNP